MTNRTFLEFKHHSQNGLPPLTPSWSKNIFSKEMRGDTSLCVSLVNIPDNVGLFHRVKVILLGSLPRWYHYYILKKMNRIVMNLKKFKIKEKIVRSGKAMMILQLLPEVSPIFGVFPGDPG